MTKNVKLVLDLYRVAERGSSEGGEKRQHHKWAYAPVRSFYEINVQPLSQPRFSIPSLIQLTDFVCQSCYNVLAEPVETKCSHSVCKH